MAETYANKFKCGRKIVLVDGPKSGEFFRKRQKNDGRKFGKKGIVLTFSIVIKIKQKEKEWGGGRLNYISLATCQWVLSFHLAAAPSAKIWAELSSSAVDSPNL